MNIVAGHTELAGSELIRALEPFRCRAGEPLWLAIEKALDNGHGVLFVEDESGRLMGGASLSTLRAALKRGDHLIGGTAVAACVSLGSADLDGVVPVLDDFRRLIGVELRPDWTTLAVAEPNLSSLELRNLLDAYLSTWISSTGSYVTEFERNFASATGAEHGIATANGSVSLQLALAALGIGPGDEVIVPDLTFAASANAVIHAGARPVFADIDPESWSITVDTIAPLVTSRTCAVMPVHVFGRPAPMTEIVHFCRARSLHVVEDCAEAHGARYDGQLVGSFSDIASFSFFANKIVTSGEGGMCVTSDRRLADRMRVLRDHGMRPGRRYWHEEVGFNFRMTNLQAAIGCAQLDRMQELLAVRSRVHELYIEALEGIPGVTMARDTRDRARAVTWFSCAIVPPDMRAELIGACKESGIDLRPFFHGLSEMPAYRDYPASCPVSRDIARRGVNLPTSHKVDARIVGKIATVFERVLS